MLLPQYLSQSLLLHHIENAGIALRTSWKEFGAFNKAAHLSEYWGSQDVRFVCFFKKKNILDF